MNTFKVGLYDNNKWAEKYKVVKRTAKTLHYIEMVYNKKHKKYMPSMYNLFGEDYNYIEKKKIRKDNDNNEYMEIKSLRDLELSGNGAWNWSN